MSFNVKTIAVFERQAKRLIKKYPSLKNVLENQIHGMVSGAVNHKHEYLILDQKIVYKDNDSISPNISYGYKTVFANFNEYSRNAISKLNF